MSQPEMHWEGQSGTSYGYWIYKIGSDFKKEAGNYIYAKETEPRRWRPIYIGETESLGDRLADHEKEECAKQHGATHIHAHLNNGGEVARRAEETDLVRKWDPACNE